MKLLILVFVLLTGCSNYQFNVKENSAYLQGNNIGVILAHGRGKYPTWKVVNPLRKAINKELGFTTLSIQMPTYEEYHWKVYGEHFDEVEIHIKEGVKFLKQRGVSKIYLIGHSMGSRMSAYYASRNDDIVGVVIIGCRNNGGYPLDCSSTIIDSKVKVLDVFGLEDEKDTNSAKERKSLTRDNYQQVGIDGAGHKFIGYTQALTENIIFWLKVVENTQQ